MTDQDFLDLQGDTEGLLPEYMTEEATIIDYCKKAGEQE